MQYDAAGRPTVQANANPTTMTRTYSPERGFLTGIVTTGPSSVQNLVYTPDPAGMVTQVTSPFPNERWTYGYDDLDRLTSATGDNSQTFQYDEIGRMTFNSRVGTYTYPSPGTPGQPAHAPDHIAGQIINYDPNGNTTWGRKGSATWNADNQPSQIGTTQFTYDGLGDRLKKVTGSSTSIYPLGDDYEIANGVVTKYISVNGIGVVAKRVGSAPNIATYWLHTDRLGSIQAVTDGIGIEQLRRTYFPYGDKIGDTTSHTESRAWIGERTDETGLMYLHARYYDPELGTFLSSDPIGPNGGLNEYGYGMGDPINSSDRSGLVSCVTSIYFDSEGFTDVTWGDCPDNPHTAPGGPMPGPGMFPKVPRPGAPKPTPTATPTPTGTPTTPEATPNCEGHHCRDHEPRGGSDGSRGTGDSQTGQLNHLFITTGKEAVTFAEGQVIVGPQTMVTFTREPNGSVTISTMPAAEIDLYVARGRVSFLSLSAHGDLLSSKFALRGALPRVINFALADPAGIAFRAAVEQQGSAIVDDIYSALNLAGFGYR